MQYRHKLVRDLAWVLHSAPLVQLWHPDSQDAWSELLAGSSGRLQRLDDDVSRMEEFMADSSAHLPCKTGSSYLTALVQFWLMFAAEDEPHKVLSAVRASWHRLAVDLKLLADVGTGACLHHECELVCAIAPVAAAAAANIAAVIEDWCRWAAQHTQQQSSEVLWSLNEHLACCTYLVGHQWSAADQAVSAMFSSQPHGLLRSSHPHLARWLRLMSYRPVGEQQPVSVHGYPLAELVSVDLEANLMHKFVLAQFKQRVAQASAVQTWTLKQLPRCDRVVNSLCLCGDMFSPLSTGTKRWWCTDVEALLCQTSPESLWAVVDQRHMLGPASVVTLQPNQLHFSRRQDEPPETLVLTATGSEWSVPEAELQKGTRGAQVQILQELFVLLGLLTPRDVRSSAARCLCFT